MHHHHHYLHHHQYHHHHLANAWMLPAAVLLGLTGLPMVALSQEGAKTWTGDRGSMAAVEEEETAYEDGDAVAPQDDRRRISRSIRDLGLPMYDDQDPAGSTARTGVQPTVVDDPDSQAAPAPTQPKEPDQGPKIGDVNAYKGVIPGVRDRPARFDSYARRRDPYLMWMGYNAANPHGLFILTSRPVTYDVRQGANGETILELEGARLPNRNTGRFMDFSHFHLPVTKVEAQRTRNGVRITIVGRQPQPLRVQQRGDYLFIDLPTGMAASQ